MDRKKILVVEDEFITASDIRAALEGMGFEVVGTEDTGEGAVRAAQEQKPDVVLMDIILKGEMNGITAAGIIRQKYDIPVIYLTGQSDDATINRALESEPFGYIVKPFNERNLKTSITMALYKHTLDEKLKESEQITRALLNATGDPMFMIDREINVLVMNDAFLKTPPDAGKPPTLLTLDTLMASGQVSTMLAGMIRDHFNDKKPFRFEEEVRGAWFDHRITPLVNHRGEIVRCAVNSHDITDIKKNEQNLQQLNDRLTKEKMKLVMFEAAVNGMDDNVIITDSLGGMVFVNTAFQKHFGYTQDEIRTQHISILKEPEDMFDIGKSRFIEDRKSIWTGNLTAMNKHKIKIRTTLKSSPIVHENQPLYRVFVLRERFQ
jgi:PAS domain S-box-containing protein